MLRNRARRLDYKLMR
ncbi:hypothetical protein [Escherichia coli]|nr:hypothetical protein [Escherichia coli]